MKLATGPCPSCPYRKDVPSGVWSKEEYDKLPDYDKPTFAQPFAPFGCHAEPHNFCFGWLACHMNRGQDKELLALRLLRTDIEIPTRQPGLFRSGRAAQRHGLKDLKRPGPASKAMASKLLKKYKRLRHN